MATKCPKCKKLYDPNYHEIAQHPRMWATIDHEFCKNCKGSILKDIPKGKE